MLRKPFWVGLIILLLVWSFLTVLNFPAQSFFSGWDNLHPEFNLPLNAWRAFVGVWQEHQGLGHVGGHGYAATLPHTLIIWLLSLAVPQQFLRSVFTFLALLSGAAGAYMFIAHLLRDKQELWRYGGALCGALYYLLNFATVQQFYIQLEAFIVQYATIPWLLYLLFLLLHSWNRRIFLLFLIINVIATIQGFIPPLFLVYIFSLCVILAFYFFQHVSLLRWNRCLGIVGATFFINAYWLLPVTHYTIAGSRVFLSAYNNILSTQSWIETNATYGTLQNLMILKGFPSKAVDTVNGLQIPIFQPWLAHFAQPAIAALGVIFFLFILLGALHFLRQQKRIEEQALVVIFFVLLALLATQIPGISRILEALQQLPILRQAFRAGFTKISIALALSYSILFAFGVTWLIQKFATGKKYISQICFAAIISAIVLFSWPAFRGHFLYQKAHLSIPTAYQELFNFFAQQEPHGRIATLPQGDQWGWDIYRWGYTGSGFLWFGIPQSLMEQAFNVWSRDNENYYWELIDSLYAGNVSHLEKILAKYQIDWIIFDESVIPYPSGKHAVYVQKIKELLEQSSKLALVKTLPLNNPQQDHISIYKFQTDEYRKDFISLIRNAPSDGHPYIWTSQDQAFHWFGSYIKTNAANSENTFALPFRSLFTGRLQEEKEFYLTETLNSFIIQANQPLPVKEKTLILPPLEQMDFSEKGPAGVAMYLDGSLLKTITTEKPTETTLEKIDFPHGVVSVEFPKIWGEYSYDNANPDAITSQTKRCDDSTSGNTKEYPLEKNGQKMIHLENTDSSTCLDIFIPNLPQKLSYLITIDTKNIQGQPITLNVINAESERTDLIAPLISGSNYIILSPKESDGLGYSIRLVNASISQRTAVNEIGRITINPIPYRFLTNIRYIDPTAKKGQTIDINNLSISHPNPAYYKVSMVQWVNEANNLTLILSQSFDPGWTAWEKSPTFPYFKKLNDHVLVKNWSNGWTLRSNEIANNELTIVIFFLPQLLQWLGFLLLPIPFLLLYKKRIAP